MRVLITYHTVSGNTKKVADAIYKEIRADKEMLPLEEVKDLKGYDLAFIGFPIQGYGPSKEAKEFLESKVAGKDIALFVTHSAPEEGEPKLEGWLAACKMAASSANIVGFFHCRGQLAQNIKEIMLKSDDPQLVAWAERSGETLGQPDRGRLKKAAIFAKDVMAKYKK